MTFSTRDFKFESRQWYFLTFFTYCGFKIKYALNARITRAYFFYVYNICVVRLAYTASHTLYTPRPTMSSILGSRAKDIIFNVSEYFRSLSEESTEESTDFFLARTAAATGVSRTTVVQVRREKKECAMLSSPKRQRRGPYKPIDDFDQTAIRNKVAEFYTIRKLLPTLKSLLVALKVNSMASIDDM